MPCTVNLTISVEGVLDQIWNYIAHAESPEAADRFIDELGDCFLTLEALPKRGHITPETKALHIKDYRIIHYHTHRIIYLIDGEAVFIQVVLNGRRDMQTLLHERLIR